MRMEREGKCWECFLEFVSLDFSLSLSRRL
jgi:hypothetical protein